MSTNKRIRDALRYNEDSQDDADVHATISSGDDIPSATSRWTLEHRKAIAVSFVNSPSVSNIIPQLDIDGNQCKNLVLKGWDRARFKALTDADVLLITESLSDLAVGTIISKTTNIIIKEEAGNIREAEVDSFMMSLLQYMRFDEWPCFVEPQYRYSFKIESRHVASVVDFLVVVNRRCVLLFVEDKHTGNTGSLMEWSEPQIAGEILASAFHDAQLGNIGVGVMYPLVVYAVRVVGTRFTFYRADVTKEYMREVSTRGLPKNTTLTVLRYPPQASSDVLESWDFCDYNDRIEILKMLYALRQHAAKYAKHQQIVHT
jgi:hypothetical protein